MQRLVSRAEKGDGGWQIVKMFNGGLVRANCFWIALVMCVLGSHCLFSRREGIHDALRDPGGVLQGVMFFPRRMNA